MNKTELVEKVAFDMGLKKAESKEIVEKVFSLIVEALEKGDDVSITGFASMRVVDRPAKRSRHNGTGKMMEASAGKRVKVSMSDLPLPRLVLSHILINMYYLTFYRFCGTIPSLSMGGDPYRKQSHQAYDESDLSTRLHFHCPLVHCAETADGISCRPV